MRTRIEALTDKIDDSINEINKLISISYTEEDYSEYFKIIGGEVEKFLKSTVYNLPNKNFYELIEQLRNNGLNQNYIVFLHDFRLAYNGYKHNDNYSITILDAKKIFTNLKESIRNIQILNIGNINLPYQNVSKRVVWFAGWDDYIGGMTECDIFIPDYEIDMPRGIEHFNINWREWDTIIKKFTDSNELFMGKEYVSEKAYNFWKAQSDFLNAGMFVGDVSEFVRELSKCIANNEDDLMPFLRRDHDSYSVSCSIVFSIYDSIRDNKWTDLDDLKDEILLRMSYDYGINLKSPYLEYINHIDLNVLVKERNILKDTNDILWLDEKSFKEKQIGIISEKLEIGFDKNINIITRIK